MNSLNKLAKIPKLNLDKYKQRPAYDPLKQVEGLKTRLDESGIDAEKATDNRSWLEKALNLTPDQNTFFDILEVLERPQRALFGAVNAMQTGEDVGKAALAGVSGKEEVMFKDILQEAGMEDSGEAIGLDDILGFAGEIFLDPVDLALIPVTAGGNIAVKAGAKGLKAIDTAKDVAKAVDTAADVAKATKFISPLQAIGRGVKTGGKKTFSFLDTGISKLLQKLDEIDLKAVDKALDVDEVRKALNLAQGYTDLKKSITGIFNVAKALPKGLWEKTFGVNAAKNITNKKLEILAEQVSTKIDNGVEALAKNPDYIKGVKGAVTSETVGKDILDVLEYKHYKPKGSVAEILNGQDFVLSDDIVSEIKKPLKEMGFNIEDTFKPITLENGTKAWIAGDPVEIDKLNKKIKNILEDLNPDPSGLKKIFGEVRELPRFYSPEQMARFEELLNNKEFMDLANFAYGTQQQMLKTIDDVFSMGSGATTKFSTATPSGFFKHGATTEYQKIRGGFENFNKVKGSAITGNLQEFTERKFRMSVNEANQITRAKIDSILKSPNVSDKTKEFFADKKGVDMFKKTIQASINDFIIEAPEFAKHAKMVDEVLARGFLLDNNLITELKKTPTKDGLTRQIVPRGYTEIGAKDLQNKLKGMSKYISSPEALQKVMKELPVEGRLAIDNNVFMLVGRLGTPKETNRFVSLLDTVNNLFKKNKLLSPGFQMRNFVGNTTNMYLAGVPVDDVMKEFIQADKILKTGPDLFKRKTLGEVLTSQEEEMYKIYEDFVKAGFDDMADELYDIPKNLRGLQQLNNKLNQEADKRFRMSLMMYANKNPGIYQNVGAESSQAFVRRVLFDPSDLSAYERNTIKKLVPFYTFAKKNLAYQMKNVIDNPKKYKNLQKAVRSMWDAQDIDVKEIEQYKRENFWIPIPGLTKDGKYVALKSNLPIGDLAEFFDDPVRRVVSSLSPALRAPFELTANKQMFTDMPIQDFKGQQGYLIPEIGRMPEWALSQVGLDVPATTVADVARGTYKAVTGQLDSSNPLDFINETVGRSLFSGGDVANARRGKAYDELREIEDLLKYYKQEGVQVKTLSEINNEKKELDNIRQRMRALLNR